MPNKTIYVSKDDTSLFEEAKQIAGEALSSVIAKALREFVANTKISSKKMREVSVRVGPYATEREKKFVASTSASWKGFSDNKEWFLRATIYHTQKNNWAVLVETVCKASLLTDKKSWRESGDFLIDSKRNDLFIGETPKELEKDLPKELYKILVDVSEKESNPVEFLDI